LNLPKTETTPKNHLIWFLDKGETKANEKHSLEELNSKCGSSMECVFSNGSIAQSVLMI
jgi:hypothetical protein